ncbi:hypothetical protein RZN05_07510 [Sphingomonas sp. HF-S4]|uniref:Uncharacterized protein n=1 Tax=Sphingomonas agrestis TaxID=3080540 RepID=A0ABU3Y6A1_9SPHN|nr:hypothetical protein [Sphingomonas sp. HF-S4]MDV3456824.1 hypothetical protein [Sphingomonas sp. HF-S4]
MTSAEQRLLGRESDIGDAPAHQLLCGTIRENPPISSYGFAVNLQ